MKKFRFILVALTVMIAAIPASAQFRWGVKAGIVANKFSFSEKTFDSSNRVGFTGGVMAEFKLPVIGIGFDASLMYVHRTISVAEPMGAELTLDSTKKADNKGRYTGDYLTLPIHVKYNLGLPVVGNFFSPYVFTGPSFSYLVSKDRTKFGINSRKGDIAWDFGLGFEIVKHLQISAAYELGCSRAAGLVYSGANGYKRNVRNNGWMVTAGYVF